MEEYSIEWFKWNRDNNSKWLGTQALKLLHHYEQLEARLEKEIESRDGWRDAWTKAQAKLEALETG